MFANVEVNQQNLMQRLAFYQNMKKQLLCCQHSHSHITKKQLLTLNELIFPVCLFCLCAAGLADRERQAHLQVRPHCGVGDTPGFTHHSAIPPHSQPSGKSHV